MGNGRQRETIKKGYNGRQVETRCREGGHTNQQKETTRGAMGDKRRQDLEAGTPSNTKAATLLRTPLLGDQEGRHGETRGVNLSHREGGHTIQQGKQEAVKGESM